MRNDIKKIVRIEIGKVNPPWNNRFGETAYFEMYYHGCILALAKPQYGKSTIMKHVSVKVANSGRRVLIIDPENKWKQITRRNYHSEYPDYMKNTVIVNNASLKISDITNEYDWRYLRFTATASEKLAQLAKRIDLHGDDPHEFLRLLNSLPTKPDELDKFNKDYGTDFIIQLNSVSHQSMVNTFSDIKDNFYDPANKEGRTHVGDWVELLTNHNVIINIEKNKREFVSFVIGWIMEQLEPAIKDLALCVFSEEADWLFGNPQTEKFMRQSVAMEEERLPKSCDKGIIWVRKYAKRNLLMFFICQHPKNLHPELLANQTCAFVGALEPNNFDTDMVNNFFDYSNRLDYNTSKNKRPFWMLQEMPVKKGFQFDPIEPCCGYWN